MAKKYTGLDRLTQIFSLIKSKIDYVTDRLKAKTVPFLPSSGDVFQKIYMVPRVTSSLTNVTITTSNYKWYLNNQQLISSGTVLVEAVLNIPSLSSSWSIMHLMDSNTGTSNAGIRIIDANSGTWAIGHSSVGEETSTGLIAGDNVIRVYYDFAEGVFQASVNGHILTREIDLSGGTYGIIFGAKSDTYLINVKSAGYSLNGALISDSNKYKKYMYVDNHWEEIDNIDRYARVATSGSYNDLSDKPTIPSAAVSGVKGNSESTYRTGNVNLTAANIGAMADGTVPINKGGTGGTTNAGAIENLFGSNSKYRMKYVSSDERIGQITSPNSGLAIWQQDDESAGVILTGNGIYIFAPPDDTALSFINEDENDITWSIDGDGRLKDANGNEIYMRGGAYLPLSGGTMTGSLTFANGTKNVVGDDCAMGDINDGGVLAIQGQNGNTTLGFVQYGASWAANSNRANLWFDSVGFRTDRRLDIRPDNPAGNYDEGIRIHPYNNWATIALCGSENTGQTGTSANTWAICNNNGILYITRNGSSNTTHSLWYADNAWHFRANGGPTVTIDSNGYISGPVHYNMSVITQDDLPSSSSRIVFANSDNWFRYMSVSKLKNLILGWTLLINNTSTSSVSFSIAGYNEIWVHVTWAVYAIQDIFPLAMFNYESVLRMYAPTNDLCASMRKSGNTVTIDGDRDRSKLIVFAR